MTIEIQEPEIEALIQHRVESGDFRDAVEVVVQAIRALPPAEVLPLSRIPRTGADIVAAFQRCPYPDFMPELEKTNMPVSEPVQL